MYLPPRSGAAHKANEPTSQRANEPLPPPPLAVLPHRERQTADGIQREHYGTSSLINRASAHTIHDRSRSVAKLVDQACCAAPDDRTTGIGVTDYTTLSMSGPTVTVAIHHHHSLYQLSNGNAHVCPQTHSSFLPAFPPPLASHLHSHDEIALFDFSSTTSRHWHCQRSDAILR